MNKPIGITFEIGLDSKSFNIALHKLIPRRIRAKVPIEKQVWLPDPKRAEDVIISETPKLFGFKLDIMLGRVRRPVKRPGGLNPWTSGNHWFILDSKIPIPGVFMSVFIKIGKYTPGIYIGCKTYQVDQVSCPMAPHGLFGVWGRFSDLGKIYLCPSFTIRKDLSK